MTATQESLETPRKARDNLRRTSSGPTVCKTCAPCRQKKVKCCGTRPKCAECSIDELDCVYPQDARREPRPSKARVRRLEATVAAMLDHMKAAGVAPPDVRPEEWMSTSIDNSGGRISTPRRPSLDSAVVTANHTAATLASTTAGADIHAGFALSPPHSHVESANPVTDSRLDNFDTMLSGQSQGHHAPDSTRGSVGPDSQSAQSRSPGPEVPGEAGQDTKGGLSSREARVAGVSHEHGCVSSVHGLASMMNRTSRQCKSNISAMGPTDEIAITISKARLISYAALQRQRESWIYRQPPTTIDFDGCEPELATHLLEVHFNLQHYAYLISYRPAIMDSIASGGGPWVNKLLLNAIYYSSSLYSDRQCLQQDPNDPQSIGARFYDRFCQLLGSAVGKPSIPSATALLLTSASLVSHGRSSAGWNLSGLAYRMVIDLGCHLTVGSDHQSKENADLGGRRLPNLVVVQEMRKSFYWGAFATDATQSLYLGRPCMFAPVEARVPLCFLDTFEELEKWEPYFDPQTSLNHPPVYAAQPAHGVSTFEALVRLFQISIRITKMYGIETIKGDTQHLQKEIMEIERDLQNWNDSLPRSLRFDPEGVFIPPPHQVIPQFVYQCPFFLVVDGFLTSSIAPPSTHLTSYFIGPSWKMATCVTIPTAACKHAAKMRVFTAP